MRRATVGLLAVFVLTSVAVAAFALGGSGTVDGTLTEAWVSDTARNNTFNHHAVGARDGIIVAPIAEVPNSETQLTDTSCTLARLAPDDGSVRWRTTIPPADCFTHALTEPAIADVDGDGSREVVSGTTMNATIVYDAASGSEERRIPLETYGYGRPAVTDLTGDGQKDVVTSDIDGGVVVADGATGEVHWRGNVTGPVWASPIVADIDDDGSPEVVLGTNDQTVAFEADGTRDWTADVSGMDIEPGQGDGDSAVELFVTGDTAVRALDGRDGAVEWETSTEGTPTLKSVDDGDGDGAAEVYLGEPGNVVLALAGTDGSQEWSTRLAPADRVKTPAPVLGDLSGDGSQELLATTRGGTVSVLDPTSGDELAAYERDVPIWTFPTLADVTESDGQDVLVRYGDGRVVALSYAE